MGGQPSRPLSSRHGTGPVRPMYQRVSQYHDWALKADTEARARKKVIITTLRCNPSCALFPPAYGFGTHHCQDLQKVMDEAEARLQDWQQSRQESAFVMLQRMKAIDEESSAVAQRETEAIMARVLETAAREHQVALAVRTHRSHRLLSCLEAWRQHVQQKQEVHALLSAAVQKRAQSGMSSTFQAWKQHACASKAQQTAVALLKAIYERQAKGRYLAEWFYQAAKQALQKKANKLQANLTVRRSWQAWVSCVKQHAEGVRRAEVHVQKAQQSLQHQMLQQWFGLSRQLAAARTTQVALFQAGRVKTVLRAVVVAWRMVARMLALYQRSLKRAMAPYFAKWRYEAAKHAMQKQADKLYNNLTVRRFWQAWVSCVRQHAEGVRRAEAHIQKAQQSLQRQMLQQWSGLSEQLSTERKAQVFKALKPVAWESSTPALADREMVQAGRMKQKASLPAPMAWFSSRQSQSQSVGRQVSAIQLRAGGGMPTNTEPASSTRYGSMQSSSMHISSAHSSSAHGSSVHSSSMRSSSMHSSSTHSSRVHSSSSSTTYGPKKTMPTVLTSSSAHHGIFLSKHGVREDRSAGEDLIQALVPPGFGNFHAIQHGTDNQTETSLQQQQADDPSAPAPAVSKGLENLGASCYINSMVQCLVALPELRAFFSVPAASEGQKKPTGPVSRAFGSLVQELFTSGGKFVRPAGFVAACGKIDKRWVDRRHHDAQEYLRSLMCRMQEETNRMTTPPYKELKDEGSLKKQADEAWDYNRSRSSSVFTDLFAGQLQSTLQCPCGEFSHTFSDCYDVSCPLARESSSGSACNIQDCLDLFVQTETLGEEEGWNCPACKRNVCATKKLMIYRCPHVLVVHLKRFSQAGGTFIKDDRPVDVVTDALDLTPFCSPAALTSGQQLLYKLTAIADHVGSMAGGHYTARCRADQRWLNFNDDNVTEELCMEGPSRAAYLLFYTRQDVVTEVDTR